MFTSLLKDTVKDTHEQPDEEIHRVRPGSVLSTGASVLLEVRWVNLPVHGCVHQSGSSMSPTLLQLYGGFLMQTMNNY